MEWTEFLRYASGEGVAVVVGALLSVLAEHWAWYGEQTPKVKRLLFFVLSLAVPVLASALGVLTESWPLSWEATFWPALMAGFAAFTAGQAVHLRKL